MDIPLFHEKPAGPTLNGRTCLSSSSCARQESKLKLQLEAVNCLLAIYATNEIITEAYIKVMNVKQPAGQIPVEYSQAPWTKPYAAGLSTTSTFSGEHSF